MYLYLILNRLVSFLDLLLETQDVLLQGLDDSLQLHLLSLQNLSVVGSLFNLFLQVAELEEQTAMTETTRACELISIPPDCL